MSASNHESPESASNAQVQHPFADPAAEALQQIARDMSKMYEVALEVDPQLYFSGRTHALATSPGLANQAR
ncbi:hypothetical protein ABZ671_29430 [Micromonospora sp. NPDC006766]|uniref:hypothetical protein n=1 Tax=Micromonospora sp. NPDC006766 TaxID=3154778 RepID=UPI0033CA38D1